MSDQQSQSVASSTQLRPQSIPSQVVIRAKKIAQRVRLSQSGRKTKPVVSLPKLNFAD